MKKILIVDDSQKWIDYHTIAIQELSKDFKIETANSAQNAFSKITANIDNPFDIILTDMQMEIDFLPFYAGEWLIKEIQMLKQYKNTQIFIISATNNIKQIAEKYNVKYIPKYMCKTVNAYSIINQI